VKKVLLLTGCVNPNGMALTVLNDVTQRRNQYVSAIRWYLSNTTYDVVFVENTGFDITPFFLDEQKNGRLECLTFQGNDYNKSLGKGYGEMLILKYAFANSKLLSDAVLIVKITGRLIVTNVEIILRECDDDYTLFIKEFYLKRPWFASYFFVAPRNYYEMLLNECERLNDSKGYYFEHLMCDLTRDWIDKGFRVKEIFHPLLVLGQSGSTGENYKNGWSFVVKSYIRYFLHRLGFHKI